MSPVAFSRFFKLRTGKTLSDYIIDIRLGYASRMLVDSNKTISEICFECGFNNLSNFNRIFKKKRNMTPKLFRAHYGRTNQRYKEAAGRDNSSVPSFACVLPISFIPSCTLIACADNTSPAGIPLSVISLAAPLLTTCNAKLPFDGFPKAAQLISSVSQDKGINSFGVDANCFPGSETAVWDAGCLRIRKCRLPTEWNNRGELPLQDG